MAGVKVDVPVPVRTSTRPMSGLEFGSRTGRSATPGYLALEISQPLPEVCARHGRPATERRTGVVRFHEEAHGRVQSTLSSKFLWGLGHFRGLPDTDTELYGEWPLCRRCVRQSQLLRQISYVLALSGIVALIILWLMAQAGTMRQVPLPVILALAPGWFPLGLIVAAAAFGRASRYVRIRPIVDRTTVTIRAHQNFAAAIQSNAS